MKTRRMNNMSDNLIIGLGNTGTNIVKAISQSTLLEDVKLYSIDSVAASVDLSSIDRINVIPIISDEKSGSGRNRDRGRAMFEFHESQGAFKGLYAVAKQAKTPVLVITSGAGGTGSGATVPLCKSLKAQGIQVIPIIIAPNKKDPAAFHLNTNDLYIDLGEIGIETYSIFENRRGDADYGPVNQEVVNFVEVIFGKKYDATELDSIDDSDLDVILNTPGRLIAVQAEANKIQTLQKEITMKVFSGFQPVWKSEEVGVNTLMTAFSLKSMFADEDFGDVFAGIRERIDPPKKDEDSVVYDEYRNIVKDDNDGMASATLIIAGLPRSEIKIIDTEYKEATSLGDNIKRSRRPSFMNKKKASVIDTESEMIDGKPNRMKDFIWE
jgi:hypothetical protein